MKKQKDRLVELLIEYDTMRMMRHSIEDCAERLLSKGVIVLPNLRHKQMVYHIYNNKIMPLEVTSYAVRPEFDNLVQIHLYRNGFNGCCTMDDFGKTVFLTKEEAEEALKDGAQG